MYVSGEHIPYEIDPQNKLVYLCEITVNLKIHILQQGLF